MTMVMPQVDIEGTDFDLLGDLLQVWHARRPMNMRRSVYFDGEKALEDFGISLPPQMSGIGAALGWTKKGVEALTNRSNFEGFVSGTGGDDPFGLAGVLAENRFSVEFPAATVSSAVHGCSFITVSRGDVQSGEPEVMMIARAAEDSAALWDRRRRALRGFLSVMEIDESGMPSEMVMHSPYRIYSFEKRADGRWGTWSRENVLGEVTVAPLVHGYELRRPLGHSRITRSSMYFSDAGLRTVVRAEVSAEFYSAPEYYLFGADVTQFVGDDKWSALMGRIKALDIEDGDDKPDLHRFTGASPQPHTDQLRMWMSLFADDQDLELKMADSSNPSSADAIFAAKETLITATSASNELWGFGAVQALRYAGMIRGDVLTDEWRGLRAQFTDPAIVSPSARADAFSKLSVSIPGFGESEVGMEFAGLSREQITRFQADRRRAQADSRLSALVETARGLRTEAPVQPEG